MAKTKLKAKMKGDMVQVKALMSHPMETGQRKNKKTGEKIPAHYISDITVMANDKTVMTAKWGGAVSKNPYMAFKYAGAKGDKVKLEWTDNQGEKDAAETEVK